MTVSFFETGPSVSNTIISQFESEIGHELPSSYRNFLLNNNGGIPDPSGFHFDGGGSVVAEFFPLIPELKTGFELLHEFRHPEKTPLAKRIVCIAIARDFGGNRIYISCVTGEIILVDLFHSKKGITVASSFSSFIDMLEEV